MRKTLSRLLSIIFVGLAFIHFYWAFGGLRGFENALPTNEEGYKILSPTKMDSTFVGLALLSFALFYLLFIDTFKSKLNARFRKVILWVIPLMFILRAVGDFKYIGFFKQIDMTTFGKLDSMYYSPLCFSIGLMGFYILKKSEN